jgi:hypothetical protein
VSDAVVTDRLGSLVGRGVPCLAAGIAVMGSATRSNIDVIARLALDPV